MTSVHSALCPATPSRVFCKLLIANLLTILIFRPDAASIAYCQPSVSDTDLYRVIVSAISRRDYAQAIAHGRLLIERRSTSYEQVYLRIIQAARSAGELDRAKDAFESLLQSAPPNPRVYYVLGLIHAELKDYPKAIDYHKRCIELEPEFSLALIALVDAYRQDKNPNAAEAYINSLVQERLESGVAHLGAGYFYAKTDRIEDAAREFDIAVDLRPGKPAYCYYQAVSLYSAGRRKDSLESVSKCWAKGGEALDEEYQYAFLNLKAANNLELGNYSEAVRLSNQALAIARRTGDKGYEEAGLAYLALVREMQGDYSQALSGYRQAFEIAKDSGSPNSAVNLRRYPWFIGLIYYSMGDLSTALQYYKSGLELTKKANDEDTEAVYQSCIGDVFVAQNNPAGAIARYKRAVEINEKSRNPRMQNFVHDVLSSIYLRTGEYQKAKEVIQAGLKLARELPNFQKELDLLNKSGELHLRLRKTDQAINAYQESLRLALEKTSPRHAWTACAGLASAYGSLGNMDKAREYYRLAVEIMEKVRANLGSEEERAGFFQDKIEVYKELVSVLMQFHNSDEAGQHDVQAFQYVERGRARAFLDSLAESRVKSDETLDEGLLDRRRELQSRISRLTIQLIGEKAKESEKQSSQMIAEIEHALGEADVEMANLLRDLRERYPGLRSLKYPEPVTLAETQQMLDDKSVLLSYSLSEQASFLFAVSRNGFKVARLKSAGPIGESVGKLLAAVTGKNTRSSGEYRRQAAYLYRDLIEPARELLAGKSELIVIADGALHRLPFEVLLPTSVLRATQPDMRNLPYLVQQYAISYAPSASVLASLDNSSRIESAGLGRKDFLCFADPEYGGQSAFEDSSLALITRGAVDDGKPLRFKRLIHSRREAAGIARLFPGGRSKVLLGREASEENAKLEGALGRYRMIHFAAHGLLNNNRPRYSGIVLSQPLADRADKAVAVEDGILQSYEIYNLKLNADLVVLSACETGLGREIKGEGLMSLMRAFMYAGTPSVVVSLWNVDDAKSADLMIRFYRHLTAGLSKSEALRQAKLETIREGGFPYLWAPFVLIGRSG
jgi:CHAT domain-containing protein/Tfp pilus assembly protein PilF